MILVPVVVQLRVSGLRIWVTIIHIVACIRILRKRKYMRTFSISPSKNHRIILYSRSSAWGRGGSSLSHRPGWTPPLLCQWSPTPTQPWHSSHGGWSCTGDGHRAKTFVTRPECPNLSFYPKYPGRIIFRVPVCIYERFSSTGGSAESMRARFGHVSPRFWS